MAFQIQNQVIITDSRDLVGLGTVGIETSLFVGNDIQLDAASGTMNVGNIEVGAGRSITAPEIYALVGGTAVGVATVSAGGDSSFANLGVTNDLTVSGQILAEGPGVGLTVTNDAFISGNLTVVGAATLNGSGIATAGPGNTFDTLTVTNAATFNGGIAVDGAVSGNAGIVTTGDSTFIRPDGTVAFGADQSMGTFKLTNLGQPTLASDAVNKQYVDEANAGQGAYWQPVRVEADAPITLDGVQVVDSVTLANGDRVLVNAQADSTTNGIYVVNDSGPWARAVDGDASDEFLTNKTVFIEEGQNHSGNVWAYSGTDRPSLGVDAITFDLKSSAAQIADLSITTNKLADSAVTNAKIADSAVNDAKISAVAASKLTGTLNNATVSESNVTQHEAALTITKSQVSDYDPVGDIAGQHIAPLSVQTGVATVTTLSLGLDVTAILDEDDMVSNRADALASQQSIKKYVDDTVTDSISSGITTAIVLNYIDGETITPLQVNTSGVNVSGTATVTDLTVTATSSFDAGASFNNVLVANGDINANGNIIGDSATNISGIASVTAGDYYGEFRDVAPASISTTVAPTTRLNGDALQPGDLWMNSSELRQFTWYDDGTGISTSNPSWVSSSPQPVIPSFDFGGDTGLSAIDLEGGVFFVSGGTNIETVGFGSTVAVSLSDSITLAGSVEVGTTLQFGAGQAVSEISTDGTLADNSDLALPTEQAVKTYVDSAVSAIGVDGTHIEPSSMQTVGIVTAAGFVGNLTGNADTATNATDSTNAANVALADDSTGAGTYYVPFAAAATGNEALLTDATQLTYEPADGRLNAQEFNSLSDIRYKENVKVIEDPMAKILDLRGVTFDWKYSEGSSAGIIAQEVQAVMPELINEGEEKLTVNYNGLIGLLIEAVKDLSSEVEALKAQK